MILTATTSPEDYFRYICEDDVTKEMFENHIMSLEGEYENTITELHEEISRLENVVTSLEDDVDYYKEMYDIARAEIMRLDIELNSLEDELAIMKEGE